MEVILGIVAITVPLSAGAVGFQVNRLSNRQDVYEKEQIDIKINQATMMQHLEDVGRQLEEMKEILNEIRNKGRT